MVLLVLFMLHNVGVFVAVVVGGGVLTDIGVFVVVLLLLLLML